MKILDEQTNKIGFILTYGDLETGYTFHGPFEDVIEADAYQKKFFPGFDDDCTLYPIEDRRNSDADQNWLILWV